MKKLSKYIMLLAAVTLSFVACDEKKDREPSPVSADLAYGFAQESVEIDVNPAHDALETTITLYRNHTDEAEKYEIEVLEADDVFDVDPVVMFARTKGDANIKITFEGAEADHSYTLKLGVKDANKSIYFDGKSECTLTVNIASWEESAKPAILYDGLISALFGVPYEGWYVDFSQKSNPDGSQDFRFVNAYSKLPTSSDPDSYGIYDACPWNEPGDTDTDNDYIISIHVDADGVATLVCDDYVELGVDWGYGMMIAGPVATGTYDADAEVITFPAKSLWFGMSNYNDGAGYYSGADLVIFVNSEAYQSDHMSIDDFNSTDIEWVEQESVVNVFESELFRFSNEEQKLYAAVDGAEGNPKSPYLNLFCLKDAYADGGNLAFYWDKKTNEITIPEQQYTGVSLLKHKLVIYEGVGQVEVKDVKGTEVTVLSFDLYITDQDGNEYGEFLETFSFSQEEIIFEKSDFVGTFEMNGYSPFDGTADSRIIDIQDIDGELAIIESDFADTIWTSFDDATGVLSIEPQLLSDIFPFRGEEYETALFTMDAEGNPSAEAAISLAFKLDGSAHLTSDTEAVGLLIQAIDLGWIDGIYGFTLDPATTTAAAPQKKAVSPKNIKKGIDADMNTLSTSHLQLNGRNRIKSLKVK